MRTMCCSLLLLLLSAFCLADTISERAFRLAVLPDSDAFYFCDHSALLDTSAQGMLDFFRQFTAADLEENLAEESIWPVLAAASRKLPLQDGKAIRRSQGSFAFASADFSRRNGNRICYVWELLQPLDPAEVQKVTLAEAESYNLKMLIQPADRPELLDFSFPDRPEWPAYSLAFLEKNTVLILGPTEMLRTVVENIEKSAPGIGLPSKFQAAKRGVPADSDFYALFIPNAAMRAAAMAHAAQSPQAGLFNELANLSLALKAGPESTITLKLKFKNAQSATLGKTMLIDGLFLGMLKVHLSQLAERPIPLLETMKSDLVGTEARFTCTVHQDDLATLDKLKQDLGQRFQALLDNR